MRPIPTRNQLKIDFEYDDRVERLAAEFGIMLAPHVPPGTPMEALKTLAGRLAMLDRPKGPYRAFADRRGNRYNRVVKNHRLSTGFRLQYPFENSPRACPPTL